MSPLSQRSAKGKTTLCANKTSARYRVELLEEDAPQTSEVLTAYQQLLTHQRTGHDLWRHLRAQNQLGVTKGTLS